MADIIDYLKYEVLPPSSKTAKTLLHIIEQYYVDPDGILCHIRFPGQRRLPAPKSQLVILTALRHEVILQVHDIPFLGTLGSTRLMPSSVIAIFVLKCTWMFNTKL